MKKYYHILILLVFSTSLILAGCGENQPADRGSSNGKPKMSPHPTLPDYPFPYQLDQPAEKFLLPPELVEISGLAWVKEGVLATVQDEEGNIYLFDLSVGVVTEKIKFGDPGDYEGIAVKGEDFWVVSSNGNLYEVEQNGQVNQIETFLNKDYDVEGLEWYAEKGFFLLACKGFPGEGATLKDKKTCYAYDPATGVLSDQPFLVIDLEEVKQRNSREQGDNASPSIKLKKVFQPSGIGIHPLSGDFYLISSVGKKLVVLASSGQLLHIASLDYPYFSQPEGICFSPEGIMYISTEGSGSTGKIFRFDPHL